ncbi:S-methyl-5'-thioadenosine phosphorylase [Candidatus Pacearchaeota archaeon]|nr:S-methyl-5'-thioadenosine phosphorylase [Candidatus Pacearchaeota archaeon]
MVKIGIIGGSGLDDPRLLSDYFEKEVDTPFGRPSSKISCGKLNGVEICILARHGRKHEISPSKVNYRANIHALKILGCDYIIATSAVGSLREEIRSGDLVFLDQFIDFTKFRKNTFFEKYGEVVHSPMAEPFSKELRKILIENCNSLGFRFHEKATIVVVEGPRFSTKAESFMFRNLGCDVIGMTAFPEVALANELNIPYATVAMSTDYDCWKENEESVSFEMVLKTMKENADKVKKLLIEVIPKIANVNDDFIKDKIRTIANFPKPGIMFRDITTLLKDSEGMNRVIEILCNRYKDKKVNIVAGIESRGFIIGAILANKLGIGFVPIRKKGKLPHEVIREEYDLEYGKDSIEVHKDAINSGDNVLIIDDLIATGGTAVAAGNLIKKLGGNVVELAFVIELEDLGGRKKLENLGYDVFSVVKFEGE